jgi:hypothetical protein
MTMMIWMMRTKGTAKWEMVLALGLAIYPMHPTYIGCFNDGKDDCKTQYFIACFFTGLFFLKKKKKYRCSLILYSQI